MMKTLVAYLSQTGNTKKIAEAIYGELPEEKEIKALEDLEDLEGYDVIFYGFPIQAMGPAKDAGDFLGANANGKKIVLFITHGAPEEAERLGPWLDNCREVVSGAGGELLGLFDCQGEVPQPIIDFLLSHDNPEMQQYGKKAQEPEAKGLPDEARLEQAREFAREVIQKV
jgi:flavodoxin